MEYTIYSETEIEYIIKETRTQRYINLENGSLHSSDSLFEASRFKTMKEAKQVANFLKNDYSLDSLQLRKVQMTVTDIGGVVDDD